MVESATILGAERREAESQMLDVLAFETQLANVSIQRATGWGFTQYNIVCLLLIMKSNVMKSEPMEWASIEPDKSSEEEKTK